MLLHRENIRVAVILPWKARRRKENSGLVKLLFLCPSFFSLHSRYSTSRSPLRPRLNAILSKLVLSLSLSRDLSVGRLIYNGICLDLRYPSHKNKSRSFFPSFCCSYFLFLFFLSFSLDKTRSKLRTPLFFAFPPSNLLLYLLFLHAKNGIPTFLMLHFGRENLIV